MLKIGRTGGIGIGKSTAAKIFEVLGIPVYYADEAARQIMNSDKLLRAALVKNFGDQTYEGGELNRAYLASLVFADKQKLDLLNSLTHPATIRDANRWIRQQTSSYIVKEAALLFESGAHKYLDKVIGVYAPADLRIERAMQRDHTTKEEVLQRMSRQMNEDEKMKRCDYVVTNDEQQLLVPQVLKLHQLFLKVHA
jgi:dephospho-CoA kinase